jgi:hypothetical protein
MFGFVNVKKDVAEYEPEQKVVERPLANRAHMAMRGMGKKPVAAYLTYYKKVAGAANTAFAGTFPLQPNLDSSWASWQGVFDECKVLSAEIFWRTTSIVTATASPAQGPNTVMVYDPTDASAFTSINQALEYEDFTLAALQFGVGGQPAPFTSGKAPGYIKMEAKVKKGSQYSAADNLLSSGDWRPTQDASNYYWGNFQSYTSQGGTTSVLQMECFVRMYVEFRTRR